MAAALVKNVEALATSLSAFKLFQRVPACTTLHPVLQSTRTLHTSVMLQGGRPKSFWRTKRHPANTRIDHNLPEKIKDRKAFGGHRKLKALRINKGCFTWDSLGVDLETPIVSVIHSYANKQHVHKNVIVKGSIVQIDANPFKTWYEAHKEQHNEEKLQSSQDNNNIKLLNEDVLYAKISTRPGQVGACNGYILEGKDLEDIQSIISNSNTVK
ncbi:40S ribosomal protein S8-B-like [Actinia tenebrosa]|uniref:40S ribosomal protein S8-B-like n=1 Tax=Actinia tenebrosa TaxID=6105 RepID=A0A6P8J6C7_ACTTE|nr:40S ribosomal protein S8-B-like [Actinia tenebrosa]